MIYILFEIVFIYRLLIVTQHFIKSPVLMERMYCEMCHHDR